MIECSQLRKEALKRKIQLSFEEAFPAEVYDPEFKDDTPEGRAAVGLKKMTTLEMLREIIATREPRAKKKRSLDHLFKEAERSDVGANSNRIARRQSQSRSEVLEDFEGCDVAELSKSYSGKARPSVVD
ncbi:hypothetical protein L596_009322 [Steinernema carpocapsae]|uniref:Uncharacterized protein n=1 Tax=Steinernema carpocapsae TaxID=34508 RepID=A0A4U5PFA8_STECR|nr:hypothetical protein L596_009322 [Steinernema carpocapsae]